MEEFNLFLPTLRRGRSLWARSSRSRKGNIEAIFGIHYEIVSEISKCPSRTRILDKAQLILSPNKLKNRSGNGWGILLVEQITDGAEEILSGDCVPEDAAWADQDKDQ